MLVSEEYEQSENDDLQFDSKPSIEKLHMFMMDKSNPQRFSSISADQMYIEEDEIENIPITPESPPVASHSTTSRHSSHRESQSHTELLIDEMDTFFLSMSKALKKLPRVQQIEVRSKVYNLVTGAEMEWLQKNSTKSS